MSQANSLHSTIAPPATYPLAGTVYFDPSDEDQEGARCYTLQTGSERLVVDPSKNGDPGDLVIDATEWEITAERYRGKPATKDFMRWKVTTEK